MGRVMIYSNNIKSSMPVRVFLFCFALLFLTNNLIANYSITNDWVVIEQTEKGEPEGESEEQDSKEEIEKDDYIYISTNKKLIGKTNSIVLKEDNIYIYKNYKDITTPPPESFCIS